MWNDTRQPSYAAKLTNAAMYIYTWICIFMHSLRRPCSARHVFCSIRAARHPIMKQQRHATIREILVASPVANQDDLRRKLAARGFHVTQATLSRDARELRLSKGPAGYASAVTALEDQMPGIREVLENFGLEVRQAQNLLVLITTTGSAQPVAAGMDYEDWPEVVGTIAGDDTVLVICADDRQAKHLKQRIEGYLV
jgi:transcriptional regulator of arginine metabolism